MTEAKRFPAAGSSDTPSRDATTGRLISGIRPRYRLTLPQLAEAVRAEIDLASTATSPAVARTAAERARQLLVALRDRAEAVAEQSLPLAESEEGGLDPRAVARMAGALDAVDAYLGALAAEPAPRSTDPSAQTASMRAAELDLLVGRTARPALPTDALGHDYEQVWACAEAARSAVLAAVRAKAFDERVLAVRDATESVDQAREVFEALWPRVRRHVAEGAAGAAEPLARSIATALDGLEVVLGALEGSIRRARR